VKLYRVMREAAGGRPEVGDGFAQLGVRPVRPYRKADVPAADPGDPVRPGDGGLSVYAGSVAALPPALQPGKAKFPVWEIDTADLGPGLRAVPAGPPHYQIEPDRDTTLAELQAALPATRDRWARV
jgi:hypothetical protein